MQEKRSCILKLKIKFNISFQLLFQFLQHAESGSEEKIHLYFKRRQNGKEEVHYSKILEFYNSLSFIFINSNTYEEAFAPFEYSKRFNIEYVH